MFRPWPQHLLGEPVLTQLGEWLLEYHACIRGYLPPEDAVWRTPGAPHDGEVIRHGDLGPWNSVWRDGQLAGYIDWDFAEPGAAISDIAQLAWYFVPLRPDAACFAAGSSEVPDRARRLRVLTDAYELDDVQDLLAEMPRLHALEAERTSRLGGEGREPWATFLERGDLLEFADEARWFEHHRAELAPH